MQNLKLLQRRHKCSAAKYKTDFGQKMEGADIVMDKILFYIITYIPFFSLIAAVLCTIIAAILAHRHKAYKKLRTAAFIGYGIVLVYFLIFFILGMIGFGPGLRSCG